MPGSILDKLKPRITPFGTASEATRTPARHGAAQWLLPVLALGLALRLWALGQQPFSVDEAATLGIADLTWQQFRDHVLWVEANPPAYYVLMKLWRAVTPPDEYWLRLPSAFAGAAALVPFFVFCHRAFGPRAAVCGVFLLAIAAPHVRFSQEARNYPLLFLLFVCSLLAAQALAARNMAGGRRCALTTVLGLLTAAMIYLHATGLITGASAYVYAFTVMLVRRELAWPRLLPFLAAGLGGLALAVPWLPVVAELVSNKQSLLSWQLPLTPSRAWGAVEQVLLAPYIWRLALPAAAFQVAALCWSVWRTRRIPEALGCLAALGFALLATVLISLFEQILFERTILFLLAPWTALLAAGLGTLRRPILLAGALCLLALPQIRGLQNHYAGGHYATPWNVVAKRVVEAARPGDGLLVVGVFDAVATRHYLGASQDTLPSAVMPLAFETEFLPVAKAMLNHSAIWFDPDPPKLCAFAGSGAIWILGRRGPWSFRQDTLAAALTTGGSQMLRAELFGNLRLEHWSALQCVTEKE